MAGKTGLSPKQQRFVEEYVVDLNATQAAIRAGYSPKTAEQQGPRLLGNVRVAAAIEKAKAKVTAKTEITAERVLAELARIGFMDPRKLFTEGGNLRSIHDLPDEIAACISSIEVIAKPAVDEDGERTVEHVHKIRLWDKRGALDLLGRYLALFVERKQVDVRQTVEHIAVQDTARWLGETLADGAGSAPAEPRTH